MNWTLSPNKPHVPAVLSEEAIEELRQCGLYPNAADLLATLDAYVSYVEGLTAAAQELVAKLAECEPHLTNAFMLAYTVRGNTYSGPEYGTALAALRAALAKNPNSLTGRFPYEQQLRAALTDLMSAYENRGEATSIAEWDSRMKAAAIHARIALGNAPSDASPEIGLEAERNLAESWGRWHDYKFASTFRDILCRTLDKAELYARQGKPLPQDEIDAMTARLAEATQQLDALGRPVPPHRSGGGLPLHGVGDGS